LKQKKSIDLEKKETAPTVFNSKPKGKNKNAWGKRRHAGFGEETGGAQETNVDDERVWIFFFFFFSFSVFSFSCSSRQRGHREEEAW